MLRVGGVNPTQETLHQYLQLLFPEQRLKQNSRKHVIELDEWLPDIHLAFEYQEFHHYSTTWYSNQPVHVIQARDESKEQMMGKRGETLIVIPPWWDGQLDSLVSTIQSRRPDLLAETISSVPPIATSPPPDFLSIPFVPGVGELMLASVPISTFDPTDWWVSEKYDGFRACWHPSHSRLYNRMGRTIEMPPEFYRNFPDFVLDCEIWSGRAGFKEMTRMLHKDTSTKIEKEIKSWSWTRVIALDIPSPSLPLLSSSASSSSSFDTPFESRYSNILLNITADHSFIDPSQVNAFHQKCQSGQHMKNVTLQIINERGEGSIVRSPSSLYHHGRSDFMYKFKNFRDCEALVVEDLGDKTYAVQLPNGTTIQATLHDTTEEVKPGDVVTLQFSGYGKKTGSLRSPKIFLVRPDLKWKDVIAESNVENIHEPAERYQPAPDAREFFLEFARKNNMDPLNPINWYKITRLDITMLKEMRGRKLIQEHQNSVSKALMDAFPDIAFDKDQFRGPKPFSKKEMRVYFDRFAEAEGFDPTLPENWIHFNSTLFSKMPFHKHYSGVWKTALADLYPEHNGFEFFPPFDSSMVAWNNERKRAVLNRFARQNSFSPQSVKNWYLFTHRDIAKTKEGFQLMQMNGFSLAKTLVETYDELSFDKLQFNSSSVQLTTRS